MARLVPRTYSSLLIDPNTRESVFTGIMQSGYFVVTETASGTQVFLNHDFEEGDFGIHFRDERNPWATPATSYTIQGDLTPVDPIQYDQWGNVITTAQPDEGRADTLYDTPGNDLIVCGAGDDVVIAHCGGEDWIKGGDGDDLIHGNSSTNCIIEGGAGSDVLFGSTAGSSQIFGDSYGDMKDLIEAGDTAQSTNEKGDLIVGGCLGGDNFLYNLAKITSALGSYQLRFDVSRFTYESRADVTPLTRMVRRAA